MHILIPMAGNGQRFRDAGYTEPKPLIDVEGTPMIRRVVENLRPNRFHRITLITRQEHGVKSKITMSDLTTIELCKPTSGSIATLLAAEKLITDEPLLIANCDQLLDFDVNDFIDHYEANDVDGSFVIFDSQNPHHSYVTFDEDSFVNGIAEKRVISNHAVTGVYLFRNGKLFMEAAHRVIDKDIRVNNEYYVSSVIDLLIKDGLKFVAYEGQSIMLGTPEELQKYLDR